MTSSVFHTIRSHAVRIMMLLALVFTASPALAQEGSPPASGQTLIGAFDAGPGGCPECFNPLQATAGFTWLEKYYSKLVLYDVDFTKIEGELAKSWDVSDDGLTYTFHLQDGVTWHDGEPFTANDVKFTIELAQNPDSASWIGAKFVDVTKVEAVDDHTAVLTMKEPNAAILDALTFLVMLPEHVLADITPKDLVQSDWWKTTPIGTGPFKWSEYKPGQYVKLDAYDNYWRGRPKLDSIINQYYPQAGSSVIALRAGDIKFTYLEADEAAAMANEQNITILSGPSQVANYLGFNLTDSRFDDVRVRQAFMYAIDRTSIVEQLYSGDASVLACALSNDIFVPGGLNAYDYDPDKAKSLLDEANWSSIQGQPIEIVTYYQDQLSNDVLVTIQQFLDEVGIKVELRFVDTPTFNDLMNGTDWTMFYGGGANGPDPDVTRPYFTGPVPPEGVNRAHLQSKEMDELYAKGQTTTDPDARAKVYQDICTWQNENLPWAFMWVADRFGGVSKEVENFVWTPAPGGGRYYDAAETWALP